MIKMERVHLSFKKAMFIYVPIVVLLSFCQKRTQKSFLSESLDRTYFDSKNWIVLKKDKSYFEKEDGSGSIGIKMFGFGINTQYFIKDSILYIRDDRGIDMTFLDFRLIKCNSYTTVNGNSIKLLKFYITPGSKEIYYYYRFKMPYSIADRSDLHDQFIIYVSQRKGILGISPFFKNAKVIKLHDYKGNNKLLIQESFVSLCE